MPLILIETLIAAPRERCFDLARDVQAHVGSTAGTEERAVAGVTTGLLDLGDEVTWEAVHFGVRQRLTSKVTQFERPSMFVDEMVGGAFHSFTHEHRFVADHDATRMIDRFLYRAPLGQLGVLADALFLERYMRRLLEKRAQFLKSAAEA